MMYRKTLHVRLGRICSAVLAVCCVASSSVSSAETHQSTWAAKILVEHTGIYQLTFDDLAAAGVLTGPVPSAELRLTNRGAVVPIRCADQGDGELGPGDAIEFVGHAIRGERSYLYPYSRHNTYVLDGSGGGVEYLELKPVPAASAGPLPLSVTLHHEEERIRLRLRNEERSPWFLHKLRPGKSGHFSWEFPVANGWRAGAPARVAVLLRGVSEAARALPDVKDHQIVIGLNGTTIGYAEWDGQVDFLFEENVPDDLFQPSGNELTVRVVDRTEIVDDKERLLVDVAVIDWIELEFAHRGVLDSPGAYSVEGADQGVVELPTVGGGAVAATDDGRWLDARGLEGADGTADFVVDAGATSLVFATHESVRAPDRIVVDRPSSLRMAANAAEYIMIVHRTLRDAIQPLAEYHRANGLKTVIVDIEDVYDEFNHGILHPRAIRSFVQHAYSEWQEPRLRFVLLVGDASWDLRNPDAIDTNYADMVFAPTRRHASFPRIPITPYESHSDENHRNLIPTWNAMTYDGYAASDSWFACLDDDDYLPDLAIGRIPVVTPEEVEAVVDKTLAYARSSSPGPWLRSLLLITNESIGFQRSSDRLARELVAEGFRSAKIYPQASEEDNALNTQRILDEWNEGKWAVSFLGHGGRFIWRTGPPDYRKNHDLFTLDDLDKLEPTTDLPIVLALTCYSAPFDHPNADSIGEKLLRMPERGAVAVFAASWRNSPSSTMGQIVLEELNLSGTTVGEAVLRAKRKIRNRTLVEQYNLLGDPALPVRQPRQEARVEVVERAGALRAEGLVLSVADFSGMVRVEWLDEDGAALQVDELTVDRPAFATQYAVDPSLDKRPSAVTVFAWDDTNGVAASGHAVIEPAGDETAVIRAASSRSGGDRQALTTIE